MRGKEYELILDSLKTTGVYVIQESSHEILYYNRRIEQAAPDIQRGMVCHELWAEHCSNCPLRYIKDKEEASSINYDHPLGESIEITAARIMWEDQVPAFLIAVTPYVETANYVYCQVLRGNLSKDSFTVIKADEEELAHMQRYMGSLSGWLEGAALNGYIYEEDLERYRKFVCMERLRDELKKGTKMLHCIFRRRVGNSFRWHTLEIIPTSGYRSSSQKVMVYVKDVHDIFREGLEREETNLRMAVIIKSRYSVMNTVDLETGICERVYLTEGSTGRRLTGSYSYYIQKALEETIAEADRDSFRDMFLLEHLREKAEGVQDFKEEIFQYRIKNTPFLWVEDLVLYIRQGNKTVVNILGRDITLEKLEEQYAQRDASVKASIINTLSSMFFATYYLDLEHDAIRPVKQKAEVSNVLGDERNFTQAAKKYAQNFICEEDREEYLKHIRGQTLIGKLSREHPLTAFEYRTVPDQNNRRAWIRANVVLAEMAGDGRAKRALYVAQDVTESKLWEEQEQKALKEACEAANHANEAKSEFMSRMSHDIRTPMNAIMGMTAIAERHLHDQERVADCLGKISVASKHLLSLVNEVLDMSRLESGQIELAEDHVNLSDLFESLVTMIQPSIQEKKQKLDLRVANVEHENVVCDTARLQQVFMNILGNAVKYTPPGGKIEIEIREKFSGINGSGFYEFMFKDNGIGMSKEFQEKMFEPFSRAEDSRISRIEGTGLGLTIARNIVRRMNGDIVVESELGKGTIFTVILSFRLLDSASLDTERFAGLPVLVADDDQADGEAACRMLENIGMKSEYVQGGEQALERILQQREKNFHYFAVILGWKMSGMDGIRTAKAIRKKAGNEPAVVLLTAYDWSSVEEKARSIGVNGFLSKPLFKSRLVYLFNQIAGDDERQGQLQADSFLEIDLTGKRILLAEDNELNREIAVEIIGQTGVTIESVVNGKEALDRFEKMGENYYDMIFMDIQMPIMNGCEAAAAIRRLPRKDAAAIPIVAMTANAFSEDIRQSRDAGMNEHLSKPIDIEQLMKCLQTWLGDK